MVKHQSKGDYDRGLVPTYQVDLYGLYTRTPIGFPDFEFENIVAVGEMSGIDRGRQVGIVEENRPIGRFGMASIGNPQFR